MNNELTPNSTTPCRTQRTGVLLVTHSPLGQAFRSVVAHIDQLVQAPLAVLDVEPEMSRSDAYEAALTLVSDLGCAEYLLMTDLPGWTSPGVVAQNVCEFLGQRAHLLGGLNMPMLLTALENLHMDAHSAAVMAKQAGQMGVVGDLVDAAGECYA